MPALRNGYDLVMDGVEFVFAKDRIKVSDAVTGQLIDSYSTIRDGMSEVTTVEDFECQVMFWLREYNQI